MTINDFLQLMDKTLVVNEKLTLNTKRTDVEEWDSVGQISILSMLKKIFGVTLEMEELATLGSSSPPPLPSPQQGGGNMVISVPRP